MLRGQPHQGCHDRSREEDNWRHRRREKRVDGPPVVTVCAVLRTIARSAYGVCPSSMCEPTHRARISKEVSAASCTSLEGRLMAGRRVALPTSRGRDAVPQAHHWSYALTHPWIRASVQRRGTDPRVPTGTAAVHPLASFVTQRRRRREDCGGGESLLLHSSTAAGQERMRSHGQQMRRGWTRPLMQGQALPRIHTAYPSSIKSSKRVFGADPGPACAAVLGCASVWVRMRNALLAAAHSLMTA